MTTFPNSPRLLKGGIVLVDPARSAVRLIIALQYNPDTLTPTLQVQGVGAKGRRPHGGVATPSVAGRAATTIVARASLFITNMTSSFQKQPNNQNYHPPIGGN